MKAACEVCGGPIRTAPNRVEIDGAVMVVCNGCSKLGRSVSGPIVRETHIVRPIQQASYRPAPKVAEPEYEIDPDYNVMIRQAREKMGLSQEDLGRVLNEKPSVIRMVESKKLKPDAVLTRKLTHHLKVTLLVPLSELEGGKTGT